MSKTKLTALLRTMPSLRHSFPDTEFHISESEVVAWLISQPEAMQVLFNVAVSTKAIKFDQATRTWAGVEEEETRTPGRPVQFGLRKMLDVMSRDRPMNMAQIMAAMGEECSEPSRTTLLALLREAAAEELIVAHPYNGIGAKLYSLRGEPTPDDAPPL